MARPSLLMRKLVGLTTVPLVVLMLVILLFGAHGIGMAQEVAAPVFTITGVDDSQTPLIRVTAYGANLGKPLAELPAVLKEDNAEQPILESTTVDVGVQGAILLDLSKNVLPRYNELADAVDRFRNANLSADTDWLAAFAAGPTEGELRVLSDWVPDHQGMANQVRLYQPTDAPAKTPLADLINGALDKFGVKPAEMPANLRKVLLVFSDGADTVSALQADTITRKAARLGVIIDTIMIGNSQIDANRLNLEQISLGTGGKYWDYGSPDKIPNMDAMWASLGAQRQQQMYTYRVTKPQPREVSLNVDDGAGRQFTAVSDFPTLDLDPPAVEVMIPTANMEFPRTADAPDTPLTEIPPTTLPIQLNITWPDTHQRAVQRIEYEIGGRTEVQTAEPFGVYEFPVASFDTGPYTLRVTAIDELGMEGKSVPVSFSISVVRPTPLPTPLPPDTPTPEPTATPTAASEELTATVAGPVDTVVAPPPGTPLPQEKPTPGAPLALETQPDGSRVLYVFGRAIPVTPATIVIALIPFLFIIAAVVLFMRRKKPVEYGTAAATEPAYESTAFDNKPTMVEQTAYELTEDATEPQVMVNFVAPASLVYVDGGTHLPPKLDIEGGREVRIGRKQAYCDVIIDDQRVSRLHASIVEKEDGKFYIKDEGSSGGTYVNRRKLRVNDLVELHHNDIINLNTVAYRFELNDQAGKASST